MSLESTSSKMVYTITGGQKTFPYPYKFFSASDIVVFVSVAGVETQLIYGSGFSFDAVQDDYPEGVNIVLAATYADNSVLVINRSIALMQQANLPDSGRLDTEVVEAQLDKLFMVAQQLQEQLNRTVAMPITSSTAVTASTVLAQILDIQTSITAITNAMNSAVAAKDAALLAQVAAEAAAAAAVAVSGVPAKASAAEIAAGTDTVKYFSSKAFADAIAAGLSFPNMKGNTVNLGDGTTTSDKEIVAENGDANKPKLRYNEATNAWQYSNNGTDFFDITCPTGGNVACSELTTETGVYTATPDPAFSHANLAFINVVPDVDGGTQINLNAAGVKPIYSLMPLQAGVQYELVYFTSGSCFLARRKDYTSAPADTDDYKRGWSVYGSAIASIVKTNRDAAAWSTHGVVTTVTNPWNVVGGGCNMVMLPNGKIFVVPYAASSTAAKVFDPSNNTFASKGSFSLGGYASGVQLPSGLTLLIPYTHSSPHKLLRLYNSTAGTLQGIAADGFGTLTAAVGASNQGGVVLDNGLVLITPAYAGTDCYLIDTVNDAVGSVLGKMDANVIKSMPIIAPDGMVYVFTKNDYYYTYNPNTNTLTKCFLVDEIAMGAIAPTHRGAIWVGKTLATGNEGIFDPVQKGMAYLGNVNTVAGMTTACLLPDGRIYMAGIAASAKIYDPVTNSIVSPAASPALDAIPTNLPHFGRQAILLNNGKLLVSSYNNINWYVISNSAAQTNFSLGTLASKIMNRR
jgi:hypothetical protein